MIDKEYLLDTLDKVHNQSYENYNKRKSIIENSNEFTITVKEDTVNGGDINAIDVIEDGTGSVVLEFIERDDGTIELN